MHRNLAPTSDAASARPLWCVRSVSELPDEARGWAVANDFEPGPGKHLAVPDGQGGLLHLHARLPPGIWLSRGEKVSVAMDAERAFVFPPEAP